MLLLCFSAAYAQQKRVSGKVVDKTGNPVNGATIIVKGSQNGTSADEQGNFSLLVNQGDVIEISGVNHSKVSVKVGASNNLGNIEVEAVDDIMEEVVVTAGGILRKKREEGYAATRVNAQQLTQAKAVNVAAGLSGKVAGLQVNAINGGVNPTVRLVLRGNRSLLGNNEALVVLDNVIVPSNILGNLNPEDIEDINVLNGAGAAALYGSDASNGAIIVTTKRGAKGQDIIKLMNTTTIESVSYYPKLQKEYGSGYETGTFTPYENQQYGPRYDGTIRQLGRPDLDGSIQEHVYSPNNSREDFWADGINNQTDFSVSSSNDKGGSYLSLQYVNVKGTTPKDKYTRASVRYNGNRKLGKQFDLNFAMNYVQNRYDLTTQTATIYDNLLNTPGWVPLTSYKNWKTDKWATPERYYNDYYMNPYFYVDNYRQKTRNDYLTGNIDLNWRPIRGLDVVYRVGLSTRNQSAKSRVGIYNFSDPDYLRGGKSSFNVPGSVSDDMFYSTQITSDLMITYRKQIKDFSVEVMGGQHLRHNTSKSVGINSNGGLVIPDLYNVSNRVAANPNGSEGNETTRQVGLYGKAKFGYKNWLYVDVTGRNDWRSVLDREHWSFFYPAVDFSFIASDAIPALKESNFIDVLKLRGGWSKVGNVNLGAYALQTTYAPGSGYPYTGGVGYSIGGTIVNPAIKPEMTTSYELGFDAELLDRRITAGFTWYSTLTDDQTVTPSISRATGFANYRQNTGEVTNKGVELMVHYSPLRSRFWTVTVGGNYTYLDNKVKTMAADLKNLQLSTGGAAQVYAIEGYAFPMLRGVDYLRDEMGRVIVDPITGYPSADPVERILGNTNPKHRLGLDLEVKYKGFRLWVLAEYRAGFYMYHNGGSTMDFSGSSSRTTMYNRERFVFPNSSYWDGSKYVENTSVQVRDGGAGFWTNGDGNHNMNIATNYLTKGDFWKVREVSLSYDVPTHLTSRVKYLKGANISVQGRNLFIFTSKSNIYTDPEYNFSDGNAIGITTLGQTPPSRYVGATLSLTF